jgi:hypothetical protein
MHNNNNNNNNAILAERTLCDANYMPCAASSCGHHSCRNNIFDSKSLSILFLPESVSRCVYLQILLDIQLVIYYYFTLMTIMLLLVTNNNRIVSLVTADFIANWYWHKENAALLCSTPKEIQQLANDDCSGQLMLQPVLSPPLSRLLLPNT